MRVRRFAWRGRWSQRICKELIEEEQGLSEPAQVATHVAE